MSNSQPVDDMLRAFSQMSTNRTITVGTQQAKPPTWGQLKKLTQEAENALRRLNQPQTPTNLLLAMMAIITCQNLTPSYKWTRDDHSGSCQPGYRDMRDGGFRRKSFHAFHYVRDRSPHQRETPFLKNSLVGRQDSPHSRSGSSVSSKSYSPERSKTYSFHQSQHRSKERHVQSLKTSRDTSPSSSSTIPSSKVLDKPNKLTQKELAEAASKWAAEKLEKADESNLPEISEYKAGSTAPLVIDQPKELESNATDSIELFEDSQLNSRSKAIASKTKEIEQVYRQDCETFGMVVKMLIEKDPSLEKPIQFALRQNLHEIGEQCVEELNHFIAEYDASS
uniref:Periphilin 1 n=1 Tax=Molossus molossus TaxID=27622 RepID=A0A7J8HE06_MOLMO|nr:periphilin 1 [Molossus molossus]